MIVFHCPDCTARLEIGDSRAGGTMTCPFCKGQVEVPRTRETRRHDEYAPAADRPSSRGPSPTVGKLSAADVEALEKEEGPKKKKRRPKMQWQLFLGGFGFPWSLGAVSHWLLISIWATVAGWLAFAAWDMRQDLGGAEMYHAVVALIASLAAIGAGLCCLSVAAIHGLTILLETTAGNDRMENWPNVTLFMEWIGQLWFLVNSALVSIGLGVGLDWLLPGLLGSREAMVAAVVYFLFPILLLCSLETDSAFLPVSGVVLASLGRHAIAWLAFYLQSGGLLAAAAALAYYLAPPVLKPAAAIPLAALLFAAVVMIYFRLLGRLAFYCSVEPDDEADPALR